MRRAVVLVVLLLASQARAQSTVAVDAGANRHPIDARVYGVAFGDQNTLSDLNVPLNRSGGNPTTRYNWQQNVDNRGFDWFFQSIPYASATPGELGDSFIASSKAGGAEAMLTIPTIGWVAKAGPNRGKLCSFSIAKYGAQQANDAAYFPDAGDGVLAGGGFVTGNDPNDANVSVDSVFQQAWVSHLVQRWGLAGAGGLRYYLLDNEPSIWFSSHRDVAPTGATMAQIRDKILDYGSKIKAVDPNAVVIGPEEWGWSGFLYSGYDQQWGSLHGYANLPDRSANGGMDYLPWLLDQLHKNEQQTGKRILDVFTVHYYPQGGEFGNDTSMTMQLLRNRSTRSLWDPAYTDQSWINDKVQLIPRLKKWVQTYYPGTQIGLTEYNWGADAHVNGATAQADVLGILGREGLDMAARWVCPDASTPTYKAIKMYRNYDGQKSVFGDTSVAASVANPDDLAAFAALRGSDGALTVMIVNKVLSGSNTVTVSLANFKAKGPVHVFQLTSANVIDHLPDLAAGATSVQTTVPPQSITLLVVEGSGNTGTVTPPPVTTGGTAGTTSSTTATGTTGTTGTTGGTSRGTTGTTSAPAKASGSSTAGGCEVVAAGAAAGFEGYAPLALAFVLVALKRRRSTGL